MHAIAKRKTYAACAGLVSRSHSGQMARIVLTQQEPLVQLRQCPQEVVSSRRDRIWRRLLCAAMRLR